jgi:hypothetical protein
VTKVRVLCLLTLMVSVALPQTKVLLYDFEARSVDQSVIKTTTQLLRDALNGTYKYIVVDPAPNTSCYNVVAAAESAKVHGAGQALVGNIMAIGGKQLLTYQLVDAATATVLLQSKVDVPPMEEFPVMADRIAQSIVARENYAATAEPEKMTSTEVEPKFKHPRKPYAGLFLTAGYNFLLKQRYGWDGESTQVKLGSDLINLNVAVSFETQRMLTLMQIGLSRGIRSESDINFDLIGNYIIGDGDFAPFVGGGIGLNRYTFTDTHATQLNDGMSLLAGGGVLGLRTYFFRLIGAGYFNMTKVSNYWGWEPGVKVLFGVSTPSMGPDATLKMSPGCVGASIGAFFLTGLIIALVS